MDGVTRCILFWRFKHLNLYFLCMRWWFSRFFKSFSPPYTIINFLFASLKLLTYCILKILTETLLRIPFSAIGWCSLVQTSLCRREKSQELTIHRRLPVSNFSVKIFILGRLKRVTGRILKIQKFVSNFKRGS
jgi:hypothetical protein